jgi:predicted DNA binding CopG/RHH family protein
MRKLKELPQFKDEAEERKFWETHDSVEYLDWAKARKVIFPNLKPSTQAISIRLPESLLALIKVRANKRDIPYQSLIKDVLSGEFETGGMDAPRRTRKVAQTPKVWAKPATKPRKTS